MTTAGETVLETGDNAILTNFGVWSPCGTWIVFDRRSDAYGERFDGTTIEAVHVPTGELRQLYRSGNGAHCGAAAFFPDRDRVAFMVGPEHPTADWTYGPTHRSGLLIDLEKPGAALPFDARDLLAPYTPGALRGGSHVYAKHPTRPWVSFTYEDHVCETATAGEANRRTTALGILDRPVAVPLAHDRNANGSAFCVVTFPTVDPRSAKPGEAIRACEEAWIGTTTSLAVLGDTIAADGSIVREVHRVDLPNDPTLAADGPLQGTRECRPAPPAGIRVTRLTHTEGDRFPGVAPPRHWLRSDSDGSRIGFLKRDESGVAQFHVVPTAGGTAVQLTTGRHGIASAFTWHPSRPWVAFIRGGAVTILDADTRKTWPLTVVGRAGTEPLPLACVFSPNGDRVAFQRRAAGINRICVAAVA